MKCVTGITRIIKRNLKYYPILLANFIFYYISAESILWTSVNHIFVIFINYWFIYNFFKFSAYRIDIASISYTSVEHLLIILHKKKYFYHMTNICLSYSSKSWGFCKEQLKFGLVFDSTTTNNNILCKQLFISFLKL